MKAHFRMPACLFAGALLCQAPAWSENMTETSKAQAVPAPESEGSAMNAALAAMTPQELASRLHSANEMEMQMADLAKKQAASDAVKSLALEMQQDHSMVDQKLQAIVAEMKLTLSDPKPVNAEERMRMQTEQDAMNKLRTLSGVEFDRLFLKMAIDAHQRAIQMASIGHGSLQPSPLRNLLEEIIPSLRSHLDRAMNIQKSLP